MLSHLHKIGHFGCGLNVKLKTLKQREDESPVLLALCEGNPPITTVPSQMASKCGKHLYVMASACLSVTPSTRTFIHQITGPLGGNPLVTDGFPHK